MRSQFIMICAAVAAAFGLTSCGTYMEMGGGYSSPVYSSTSVYDDGYSYGTSYSRSYGYSSMDYNRARQHALFLSDKMAYELGLSEAQYAAIYEINLDYLLSMQGESSIYGPYWSRRNSDIFYVLDARQYNYFVNMDYFYRPVYWYQNTYAFSIYNRYDTPNYYYRHRPSIYDTYRGGRNRWQNSYYAGRFGARTGQPVVINRGGNYNNGYGNVRNGGAVTGNRGGAQPNQSSFGNQRRNGSGAYFDSNVNNRPQKPNNKPNANFGVLNRNSRRNVGNTTVPNMNTQRGQRPSGNNSFGGDPRNGNTMRPQRSNNRGNGGFGNIQRPQSQPRFNNAPSSFGSGSSRPAPTPTQRPTAPQNSGSFGGHR